MRRRRSGSAVVSEWPQSLRHIVRAAEVECPRGHAEAMRELTALALRKIPSRGIFDPGVRGEPDLYSTIESVARTHLGLAEARAAWTAALDAAGLTFERRDDIERAALHIQTVSDTAYFYAGLAFGLASAGVYRP